jgi:glutamate synthase (NADPH/NADH) large chain
MDAKRGAPLVRRLLENHIACTGSPLAHRLLEDWSGSTAQFVSVVPDIYDRIVRESLSRGRDVRPPLPPPIRDMSLNARAS